MRAKSLETGSKLASTLDEVRQLWDIIPICSHCKSIRNDKGYYEAVDHYLTRNTDMLFSRTLRPECLREHHPELNGESS